MIVVAPASAQEMANLGFESFALADKYRTPVMILADGMLGQTMEPVILPETVDMNQLPSKPWALTGARGRERNLVLAAPYTDEELIDINSDLEKKYASIEAQEARWNSKFLDDAEVVIVAFGSSARISEDAVAKARGEGLKVGLIRPVTLWPFPNQAFAALQNVHAFVVVEMNNGQMIEDVRLATRGNIPVYHFGHGGGWIPTPQDIHHKIVDLIEKRAFND
jgi:2-oxoglutarate ferredoxin oxidoreductase subunit alpha